MPNLLYRLTTPRRSTKRHRPSQAERLLSEENQSLRNQLEDLQAELTKREHDLRQSHAELEIATAQIESLWGVVARDRERVKAETAQAARQFAEASDS